MFLVFFPAETQFLIKVVNPGYKEGEITLLWYRRLFEKAPCR